MHRILGLFVFAALLLAGCESDPTSPRVEEAVFNPSLKVDIAASTRTITGLYYRDLEMGEGAAAVPGKTVHVHYKGYLVNGTLFDQNLVGQHTPLEFEIGRGGVIPGFDEGVSGMRVGGKRQLIIPPSLGYGNRPIGGIPANSILVFDVHLVAVE